MSSTACSPDVVITKEYRRFAEFCDACRRYAYIGLCYGTPGVGKTLSARHYANWNQVEARSPYTYASDADLAALIGSHTVYYTPNVVNSPRQVEEAIRMRRNQLRAIPLEVLHREEEALRARARQQDETLVMRLGICDVWKMMVRSNLAKEPQDPCLVSAFLVDAGVCKSTPSLVCGVLDATGMEIALAQIGD